MPRVRKPTFTLDEVVAWAMWKTGINVNVIAQKVGVGTRRSVYRRAAQVEKILAEKFDVEQFKNACLLCYPLALESLVENLKKHDVSTTQFFLSRFLGLNEKPEGMNVDAIINVFNIHAELRKADTESLRSAIGALRNRIGAERMPPMVLCESVSPHDKG